MLFLSFRGMREMRWGDERGVDRKDVLINSDIPLDISMVSGRLMLISQSFESLYRISMMFVYIVGYSMAYFIIRLCYILLVDGTDTGYFIQEWNLFCLFITLVRVMSIVFKSHLFLFEDVEDVALGYCWW